MPRVYRSPVKETTRKAPLESPHPHPPYQPLHAAEDAAAAEETAHTAVVEEARHIVAEEAAQADTPRETEHDTPSDTYTPPDTDNPTEIQVAPDNAAPDTPALDNVAHAGNVSGPPSGIDPSVTSIPPQHQP